MNRPQYRFPANARINAGGNNLIQSGALQRRVADWLNLKEQSPIPTLAPELQAVMIVDDITKNDRSDTRQVVSRGANLAAVAAQNAVYELQNPAGSGVLARMISVMTSSPGANVDHWLCGLRVPILGGATACPVWNSRDSLQFGNLLFAAVSQVGLPGFTLMLDWYQQTTTPAVTNSLEGCVLAPGQSIVVANLSVNLATACTLRWTEEALAR